MYWGYWTLSLELPAPALLWSRSISAFFYKRKYSWSQRKAGTQGSGSLCKVTKLRAEGPLKCVSKNHGKDCDTHFGVSSMALRFGVGSAVNVTHRHCSQQLLAWGWIVSSLHRRSSGGDSRKLWEEPLTRDLASLTGRVFGLRKPAGTEGTQCYEPADSQANGADCLPRGCTAFSQNLCLLGKDIGDFWHCNSNLAAALNSPCTSLPLLVQYPHELPCSRFRWDTSPSSDPALLSSLPCLAHSSNLAPIPHCVSNLQNRLMGTSDIDLLRGRKTDEMIVFLKLLFQDVLWPFRSTSLIKNAYVVQEIWLVSMRGLLNC